VAKAKVSEVKQGVGGTWDKLEHVFEDRVARALSKLGVHTQSDVERLTERAMRCRGVNELIKGRRITSSRRAAAASAAGERWEGPRTADRPKPAKKTSRAGSRTAK
jgi:hypothetical protein